MEATTTTTPVVEAATKSAGARFEGKIKNFDAGKGYGFITQDATEKEVFVHKESIEGESQILATGDRVSYEVSEGPKGPRAASVRKM